MYACERAPPQEKLDFHQIYSVLQSSKEDEIKAKIVNTASALKCAIPCKLQCKYYIYHICLGLFCTIFPEKICVNLSLRKKKKKKLLD